MNTGADIPNDCRRAVATATLPNPRARSAYVAGEVGKTSQQREHGSCGSWLRGATRQFSVLDLFSGAGGAAVGLSRAGYNVTGYDIRPQPRYPFQFIRGDATRLTSEYMSGFDFIWASPPCQRWTAHAQQHGTQEDHPDYIARMRALLVASGRPYCIENVPRSPLRPTAILTGDMFGLNTYRKRHFETNFVVFTPMVGRPFGPKTRPGSVTVTGHSGGSSKRDGWSNGNRAAWQAAMGIDWMTNAEMAEAIPPAYSEFIARQARGDLKR